MNKDRIAMWAGQAMQGYMSTQHGVDVVMERVLSSGVKSAEVRAKFAFIQAEAMEAEFTRRFPEKDVDE